MRYAFSNADSSALPRPPFTRRNSITVRTSERASVFSPAHASAGNGAGDSCAGREQSSHPVWQAKRALDAATHRLAWIANALE